MSLKNAVTPPANDAGTIRLVAQRLNHYATPDPTKNSTFTKNAHFFEVLSKHIDLISGYYIAWS
jgi:hypothetical protein